MLAGRIHRTLDAERSLGFERLGQVHTLQALHDHEGQSVVGHPHVVGPCDVVAAQPGRRARFPEEPAANVRVLHEGWKQHLDGDRLLQVHVQPSQHGAHPSKTDDPVDLVLASDDIPRPGKTVEGTLG